MKNIILLLLVIISLSCKDNKKENNQIETEELVKTSYKIIGQELLNNVKFNRWVTNAKPVNWEINKSLDIPENYVVDRDTLDLLLTRKEEVNVYIRQRVSVTPNTYYVLSGDIGTRLRHGSYTGLIVSTDDEKTLGKKIFDIRDEQQYKVVFNSKNYSKINCFIGFVSEGRGDIMIKSISLKEIKLDTEIYDSKIAKRVQEDLELNFLNEKEFDFNIEKISKYISKLMLSKKRKDSVSIIKGEKLIGVLSESSYLKKILEEPSNIITKSYTTKLVYSVSEILNEMNIGVKIIEFRKNNKRNHLALMYYNSFSDKWITIDPFFNSKIITDRDLSLIKKEEISSVDYGGLVKNDSEGLIKKYSNSRVIIMKEKIIGYPF